VGHSTDGAPPLPYAAGLDSFQTPNQIGTIAQFHRRENNMSHHSKATHAKPGTNINLADEQHHRCIELAAYYIAENSGFNGCDVENWMAAEKQVNQKLVDTKL
jgi:hypothetical protein